MSRDRDPYERTLGILRQRLRAGEFGEGQPLQIQMLAADLNVSSTPVREALSRLLGEGLIERAVGGYHSVRYDAAILGEFYRLDEVYARAAMAAIARNPMRPATGLASVSVVRESDHVARTEALLARLGAGGGQVLAAARRNLWDRLAPFRNTESFVFDDLDAEAGALSETLTTQNRVEIQALLRVYFRRRQRAAPEILGSFRLQKYQPDIP